MSFSLSVLKDINECSEDRHGCDPVRSNCSNTLGGFKCYCLKGYEEDENDECKGIEKTSQCVYYMQCNNYIWPFTLSGKLICNYTTLLTLDHRH